MGNHQSGTECCRSESHVRDRWGIDQNQMNTTLCTAEIKQVQLLWDVVVARGYDIEIGIQALRGVMARYPQVVSQHLLLNKLNANTIWIKEANIMAFVHAMMEAMNDVIKYLEHDQENYEFIQAKVAGLTFKINSVYLRTALESADAVIDAVLQRRLTAKERRAWRRLLQYLYESLVQAGSRPLRQSSWRRSFTEKFRHSKRQSIVLRQSMVTPPNLYSKIDNPHLSQEIFFNQSGVDLLLCYGDLTLTTKDKINIKRIWKHIKAHGDEIEFGYDFFREILSWYPKTIYNFPISRAKHTNRLAHNQKWYKDSYFVTWVKDFMKKVGLVMIHLDDQKKLAVEIGQISKMLQTLKMTVRHVKVGLNSWRISIIKYAPESKLTDERRASWCRFINWLLIKIAREMPHEPKAKPNYFLETDSSERLSIISSAHASEKSDVPTTIIQSIRNRISTTTGSI